MWAKYPRSEVKQPRGDEVGLQEQSSEGSGNVQTLLPKIYWPGQRDGEAILEIRGTLPLAGPGADLETDEEWNAERWQYGKEISEKETTQLYLFFILTQDPSYVWLLWSLQEARRSLTSSLMFNWYIRLMANNCFRALKWQAKSLKMQESAFF